MANVVINNPKVVGLKLPKVRVLFRALSKPDKDTSDNDNEFKNYRGVTVILDKDNEKHMKVVEAVRADLKAYKLAQGKSIKNLPIKDGDKVNAEREEEGEEPYETNVNAYILDLRNSGDFPILNGAKERVSKEQGNDLIYQGCYVNVILTSTCFTHSNGATIRLNLDGIMFAMDGDSLAGGLSATEEDFDDFESAEGSTDDEF